MKKFVNGVEAELSIGIPVTRTEDRLMVRTANGIRSAVAVRSGDTVTVSFQGSVYEITKGGRPKQAGAQSGDLKAPMPGAIVDVLVSEGQSVTKGERLLVLEAMKTQQPFLAPFDGVVAKVLVAKGDQVADGALLVQVSPAKPE